MLKRSIMIALSALFFMQTSFAMMYGDSDMSNKQCDAIADACKSAGYTDEGMMGDKSFWFACMKPVLYGKMVNGVTLDKKDIKECRKAKIAKMKQELHDLQMVKE